jgi:glutathione peroxidase
MPTRIQVNQLHHPFEIPITTIDGRETTLDEYRDNVILIVNVASHCGCTPQYADLESLYRKYKDRGFVVLGFPCNQFFRQEPDDVSAIQQFCSREYGVTFPLFEKVKVNGRHTHPLYQFLKSQRRGTLGTKFIKWNFTKFLIDRGGAVVCRYGPFTKPKSIEKDVVILLQSQGTASNR